MGTWAVGGNLNITDYNGGYGAAGDQNNGFKVGFDNCESYSGGVGGTWTTEAAPLYSQLERSATGRDGYYMSGPAGISTNIATFNLGTWSAFPSNNVNRDSCSNVGQASTATVCGILMGEPSYVGTENYGGGSWAVGQTVNQARQYMYCGSYGRVFEDCHVVAGYDPFASGSPFIRATTERKNILGFYLDADLNEGRQVAGAGGVPTTGIVAGGWDEGATGIGSTEVYNGTVWSNDGSLVYLINGLTSIGAKDQPSAFCIADSMSNTEIRVGGTPAPGGSNITSINNVAAANLGKIDTVSWANVASVSTVTN